VGAARSKPWVRWALSPRPAAGVTADARWVSETAGRVLAVVEERRSTWQMWHVRAEAQRWVRTTDVRTQSTDALVDLVVDEVLHSRSVLLAPPGDGIEEPEVLRRVDGASVYTVAGADLYTSQRILDAEQRLIATAGRRDGTAVDESAVDLALLEMAANGTALDPGQAALVRQMCTSGARLQLAIAPAEAGKTTAMRALTSAWAQDGGQVIGLAPSAAAAAVLGEQTGIHADTLAKLTWSLQHNQLPDWAARIGPRTLVIIDEAGMADTLTLDRVVHFVTAMGGSVRLVGDDQQLAAIGAGGILRDIKHTHGSLQLTELHRFTHPAEAAATLALRDGDPASLDFYLDHGRVYVGDLTTTGQDTFQAWAADRTAGLDAIMLAPTRELVSNLNHRALTVRLGGSPAGREVQLADGNQASVGDVIITRSNNRRLRLSAADWVKNGDRWTISHISRHGDLTVRHTRSQLTVRLPADYVGKSVELGYATTIHAAQGVTADTMHGLATGQESRQQLYTMLTRGRIANHLYLQVVGDGDLHTVIRPETVAPRTPANCWNRSWPAMTAPPLPPPSSAKSAILRSGCIRRSRATPMACMPPPNSSSDPGSWVRLTAEPTKSSPTSPPRRPGRPCAPISSPSPPKPANTRSSTSIKPQTAATSAPPPTSPPSSTGASRDLVPPRTTTALATRNSPSHQGPPRLGLLPGPKAPADHRPRRPHPTPRQPRQQPARVGAAETARGSHP
jgi:hypothetical protein